MRTARKSLLPAEIEQKRWNSFRLCAWAPRHATVPVGAMSNGNNKQEFILLTGIEQKRGLYFVCGHHVTPTIDVIDESFRKVFRKCTKYTKYSSHLRMLLKKMKRNLYDSNSLGAQGCCLFGSAFLAHKNK